MPITLHRVDAEELEERRRVPLSEFTEELRSVANERADLLASVRDLEDQIARAKTRAVTVNMTLQSKLSVLRDNEYPDPDWLPTYEERYPNPEWMV